MAQEDETTTTITGTVVSSGGSTIVVKTESGQYRLFAFDRTTVKPKAIAVGSRVQVVSTPGDDPEYRLATTVTVIEAPAKPQPGAAAEPPSVIPPSVRRVEQDIERQSRKYGVGLRAGVALDPELVLIGIHARLGPIFTRNLALRPNLEFAFGEVTSMFGINLEAVRRLPINSRQGRWSAYAGIGPGFNFIHQGFKTSTSEGSNIDFGDFHYSTALNVLGGVQFRKGVFVELKSSVYAKPAPGLRLIFGYNF